MNLVDPYGSNHHVITFGFPAPSGEPRQEFTHGEMED